MRKDELKPIPRHRVVDGKGDGVEFGLEIRNPEDSNMHYDDYDV